MARRIDGMGVFITGASAGIGKALAECLAARGARVALAARRLDRLQAVASALGPQHLALRCDVADPADCARAVAEARAAFGRLDVVVCNAGYGLLRTVEETTPAEWQAIFATNVLGTTEVIRAALPGLRAQELRDGWRGQVVIVSSCLARRATPHMAAYSATKAAQLSLAEALRIEVLPQRIAVTTVHPVLTETEFGSVMESGSAKRMSGRSSAEPTQSAATVAAAIARGIARPRAEVWPHGPTRWLVSLATLFPGLADRTIAKHQRTITPVAQAEG